MPVETFSADAVTQVFAEVGLEGEGQGAVGTPVRLDSVMNVDMISQAFLAREPLPADVAHILLPRPEPTLVRDSQHSAGGPFLVIITLHLCP